MSYVRWSSIVDCELTNEDYSLLLAKSLDEKEQWCKENKNPNAELSDWYIFWHSMSGDESNKKEDQYLAMWMVGEEGTPVLDYTTVKNMLETDDRSPLKYKNITQKHALVDCVKRWLNNVESESK